MFSKKLLIPLLSLSLLVTPAYSSHAAENAEAAGTSVEGQGMLSPSSSSESSESVFNGSGAGTSSEPVTDEKLETILKQVQSQLPAENGTWAVFISDLVNGTEGSLNDQKMQAASLIKLYIMGAVYENYDQITGQYRISCAVISQCDLEEAGVCDQIEYCQDYQGRNGNENLLPEQSAQEIFITFFYFLFITHAYFHLRQSYS